MVEREEMMDARRACLLMWKRNTVPNLKDLQGKDMLIDEILVF